MGVLRSSERRVRSYEARSAEAAVVAATLLAAIIALRMSAKNPGRAVGARPRHPAPGLARAVGHVARGARHHRRRRALRRADPRPGRERRPGSREQAPARRADRDAPARRGERALPAAARAAGRDARRDHRRARHRRRRLPVLPGGARRDRPRRGDGPARDAGAHARGGGRGGSTGSRARART